MKNIVLFIVLTLSGCQEIFEKNISERGVELVAPVDSVETYHQEMTFAWKEREGATGYRLLIVSPSFERAELYVLDTLVEGLQHTHALQAGKYQWAVRPENSAYTGLYGKRTLTVLEKPEEP